MWIRLGKLGATAWPHSSSTDRADRIGLMQLGSMAQFLSTGVRECSQFVVFLTALLHALPQLIKRSVGLCIGCDDPAHHFLGAFDYATRRYQSHAFDR